MSTLVRVEKSEVLTDTQVIAKELGMKHNKVMDMVHRFLDDHPDLRGTPATPKQIEYIRIEQRHYRGKDFDCAVMNRECFTLLFMRFETPKARQLQRKFNAAFYEMEKALLKSSTNASDSLWLEARTQSKLARREETDVIQKFVEYATAQGSQNAKHYYTHITNASYKCLELIQHKKPKLRDTLDYMQLAHLMAAEGLAARCLEQYMENGEHYKVIYELVKNDLERFAEGLKLPKPKI